MKKRRAYASGFSLVEVAIALAVVVFSLLMIMALLAIGVNFSQGSIEQTSATNVLSAVVADLQSTPNPLPRNSAQTSPVYGIGLPAAGALTSTTPTTIYIGRDGNPISSVSGASYRLSVWTTGPTATNQETIVRLLLTWPAPAAYTVSQGYLESVVAFNRT